MEDSSNLPESMSEAESLCQQRDVMTKEYHEQWELAVSALGALAIVRQWLVEGQPADMSKASMIAMLDKELGISDTGEV